MEFQKRHRVWYMNVLLCENNFTIWFAGKFNLFFRFLLHCYSYVSWWPNSLPYMFLIIQLIHGTQISRQIDISVKPCHTITDCGNGWVTDTINGNPLIIRYLSVYIHFICYMSVDVRWCPVYPLSSWGICPLPIRYPCGSYPFLSGCRPFVCHEWITLTDNWGTCNWQNDG